MSSRPNVLVFMTDQQHYETILPGSLCQTPRLDAVRERGTTFTNAFCPTPICTPTRASVQTGLLPHRHRLIHNTHVESCHLFDLPDGTPTLGSIFTEAGHRTGYVGKWHVGREKTPAHLGYETYLNPVGPRKGAGWQERLNDPVRIAGDSYRSIISSVTDEDPEENEAFRVAGASCDLLREYARTPERPFFLFASTTVPHVPWHCPRAYAERYAPKRIPCPDNYNDDWAGRPDVYRRSHNFMNDCQMNDRWDDIALSLARYYGIITLIDDAFGRILDTLDELGLRENTWILFTSDHGEMAGRHGRIGKSVYLLEDIIRTPLVIAPPQGAARREADEFVNLTDLFTTCLDIGRIAAPVPPESRTLRPLLDAPAPERFPSEIGLEHNGSHFHNNVRGIRTATHKYVFRPHNLDELYDLEKDPGETVNRIADPDCAETLADLRARLLRWMRETDDPATKGAERLLVEHPAGPGGWMREVEAG